MKRDLNQRYEALRSMLEEDRHKAGMSQQDIADALGVHQTWVSKIEKGERRLDLVEFLEGADALGIDPVRILQKIRATDTR
jgi:transcriptional regulator with XRE-family HTH domain